MRKNHPIFLVSKEGEDPQKFIDELYKIVHPMGVNSGEKEELISYQLKDVSQLWYTQ